MSNNCSGKKCARSEINDASLTHPRKEHQQYFTTRLRTGMAKIFRRVREHLFPMSSESLRRALITTTVTTTSTSEIITTRERSTTTIDIITTTASTTKVVAADFVRVHPTLNTITTTKSIIPSDLTEKVSKTTEKATKITTTTTTNIDPIAKTTITVTKTKDRDSKSSAQKPYHNRRYAMCRSH